MFGLVMNIPRGSLLLSCIPQHLSCSQTLTELPLQDAVQLVSAFPPVVVSHYVPLVREALGARLCSPGFVYGPLRRQPISMHLSFQSSFSSMTVASSGHPHPLESQLMSFGYLGLFKEHTYVQFVPVKGISSDSVQMALYLPLVVNRLDDEAQRRAHCVDIFSHNLLDNRRLSRIVESTAIRQT
jgi:hypothetical protein